MGSLCYRIQLDGKKQTLIESPCEVVQIRQHGESYYIKDLETNRIYLWNRRFIKASESSRNMEHLLQKMEVISDKTKKHKLEDWNLTTETIIPPVSCIRKNDSKIPTKRVKFDHSLFAARAELRRYRRSTSSS